MRVATLLYADVDPVNPRFCGACNDLLPTQPCQCMRFGSEGKQGDVWLPRDPATNKPIRCDQCRIAEDAFESAVSKAGGKW